MSSSPNVSSLVHGTVAPGFESVRYEFERNFTDRKELGAAFAVYHRGQKVVDLWGGHRDRKREHPWQADTLTTVYSTTKGIAALTLAHAHSQGLFEWDAPVAQYWPEFAQADKSEVTVRQLLAHQAGLCAIDEPLDTSMLADADRLATVLARQAPAWVPGTHYGYHAVTLGWYQSELLRRVDPKARSLGRYFHEELAQPLGLDIHIGLPDSFPTTRIAWINPGSLWSLLSQLGKRHVIPLRLMVAMRRKKSLAARSLSNPKMKDPSSINKDPALRAVEIPSANGIADARSIAKLYGIFATGGSELNIEQQTLDDLMADPIYPSDGQDDIVLTTRMIFALGFMKPSPEFDFASSFRAYGAPGAGGSFGFADPDAQLSMAYIMNQMGSHLFDDPREKALRDATYRAVSKFGPAPEAPLPFAQQ
jgi:CubicO group peptidase (beta-lactamase class C family)